MASDRPKHSVPTTRTSRPLSERKRTDAFRITHCGVRSQYETVRSEAENQEFEKKFRATAMWNKMLSDFRENMPRKRHRRQFTYFDDSFTGKEAVDFALNVLPKYFPDRQLNRVNTVNLLQKYMEQGVFGRPNKTQTRRDVFLDNASLYVFCSTGGGARTPTLLRRSNSFCGSSEGARKRKPLDSSALRVSDKDATTILDEFQKFELPNSPLKPHNGSVNRRLSSSYGNLLSVQNKESREVVVTTPEKSDTVSVMNGKEHLPTLLEGDTVVVEEQLLSSERAIAMCEDNEDEYSLPPPPTLGDQNNRRIFTRQCQPSTSSHSSDYASIRRTGPVPARIRSSSIGPMNRSMSSATFSPHGIQQHPFSPAVTSIPRKADSSFIRQMSFSCSKKGVVDAAAMWGIPVPESSGMISSHNRNSQPMIWRKGSTCTTQEEDKENDYGEVCSRRTRQGSRNGVTANLMNIFKSEKRKSPLVNKNVDTSPCDDYVYGTYVRRPQSVTTPIVETSVWAACLTSRLKRILGVGTLPLSHWIPCADHIRNNCHLSAQSASAVSQQGSYPDHVQRMMSFLEQFPFPTGSGNVVKYEANQGVKIFKTLCSQLREEDPPLNNQVASHILDVVVHFRNRSSRNLASPIDRNAVLRLPGLIHSPELVDKLNRMTQDTSTSSSSPSVSISPSPPDIQSGCRPSRPGISPLIQGVCDVLEQCVVDAIALILLLLSPESRARLHRLIKFMCSVTTNHCISFDPNTENRYVILEAMSECLVECTGMRQISQVQCLHIATFLLDNHRRLLTVPSGLYEDVRLASSENRGRHPRENIYCERIAPQDYEAQKSMLDRNIAGLLDQIISDPTMDKEFKKSKLRKFKKMYPEVYNSRFPNQPQKEGGILSRIFRQRNN